MQVTYHILEFRVHERGGLVRFDYHLPSDAELLTGVMALFAGQPDAANRGRKVGMLTLEVLDRKIHLATLPVVFPRTVERKEGFYPVLEPLEEGNYVNGAYVDNNLLAQRFAPYRVKLVLRTMGN
ncbi:MAG: hypothetical protein ACOYOO_05880 [Saprospiraceae bacterium]|jgi:hypothetical protein